MKLAVLNNVDHHDLKIITDRSNELGDGEMCVPTFPAEFRAVQAHYPIVFGRNKSDDGYTPLCLLGLEEGENLFLKNGKWNKRYIPACANAKPFLVGPGNSGQAGENQNWVIHIDESSPKLSREKGEPLFKEFGGNSVVLDRISGVLASIHQGVQEVPIFISMLEKLNLLEPFSAEMTLSGGENFRLEGFYTISEERLVELPVEEFVKLQASGFLFDIYMQLASLSHIGDLLELKNTTL